MSGLSKQKIGEIVEFAGVLAFAAGVIISVQHYAIGGATVLAGLRRTPWARSCEQPDLSVAVSGRKRKASHYDEKSAEREAPAVRASNCYRPFPRQREFHTCGAKYRLFGGAAGPGKTKALCGRRYQANNGLAWIRCCAADVSRTRSVADHLFPARRAERDVQELQRGKHIMTWHNGSTTRFGYSRAKTNLSISGRGIPLHWRGRADTFHAVPVAIPDKPQSLCGARAMPYMAGATNPGNIGHAWVKALWVDRRPAGAWIVPTNTIRRTTLHPRDDGR